MQNVSLQARFMQNVSLHARFMQNVSLQTRVMQIVFLQVPLMQKAVSLQAIFMQMCLCMQDSRKMYVCKYHT